MLYALITNDGENYYRLHTHNHYEIMFVKGGVGFVSDGVKKYPFSPGSIFIAPPGVPHSVFSEQGHKIINVGGNFNSLALYEAEIYRLLDNEYKECRMLCEAILRNVYVNESYAQSLCASLLQFLVLSMDVQPNMNTAVRNITHEIEKRFADPMLDVTEILNASGYAEDYIRAKFLAVTKTTPVKYLTSVRMKNAKILMSLYDISISEIAERCGMLDVAYFSRIFKKYYGVSPREYMKSVK
jgi:AraC-like DNA-binding protein